MPLDVYIRQELLFRVTLQRERVSSRHKRCSSCGKDCVVRLVSQGKSDAGKHGLTFLIQL